MAAAVIVEFKTKKDSNYQSACAIGGPDVMYSNLVQACMLHGLAAAGKPHLIHHDDTATPHHSQVAPEAPALATLQDKTQSKKAGMEDTPALVIEDDTPPSSHSVEEYLQEIVKFANDYETSFEHMETAETTELQKAVDWYYALFQPDFADSLYRSKLLYLSKAALVRRMMCCESEELASKQAVMGIFVLHHLMAAFVMRYNTKAQVFQYVTLVKCCNMRCPPRLLDAFERLHMVSLMIDQHFPKDLELDSEQARLLKIKLKATAEPVPVKGEHDDDDGADGCAVDASALHACACAGKHPSEFFLSDENVFKEVAEVIGELHGLERVGRVRDVFSLHIVCV